MWRQIRGGVAEQSQGVHLSCGVGTHYGIDEYRDINKGSLFRRHYLGRIHLVGALARSRFLLQLAVLRRILHTHG